MYNNAWQSVDTLLQSSKAANTQVLLIAVAVFTMHIHLHQTITVGLQAAGLHALIAAAAAAVAGVAVYSAAVHCRVSPQQDSTWCRPTV